MPWRTIEGEELADTKLPQLQVVLDGVFDKRRFWDLIRHFIVFEDVGGGVLVKKMAGYHQYHAVNVAVQETIRACVPRTTPWQVRESEGTYFAKSQKDAKPGDRRVGVVWHTQGACKSLTMTFYAGRVVLHPAMENPTLAVITDRNDLDDQLFGTFARCHELLRQQPVQAQSREHLRELLTTASGGVVFTTIHKFFPTNGEDQHPLLSDRRNIVVIADEAHRSQYDFIDGFARHMREALPNASFIGFTGTPIDPFKVVIVRDMWLTGFDAPCLHTMYVDKPMRGHGLMQAIARVNRVFKDKPGGLVVDYLGLADQLKQALANYTESGGKGQTAVDQEKAAAVMLERYEVCCGIFHGFDWQAWNTGGPQERLSVLPTAQEHVLAQDDGKNRLVNAVSGLSKAFALAIPHEKAME
ncbi:MAG: type I restriction enzyme endonuclease domain-containing protein, partial [Desulfoprunum sp.]